MSAAPAPAAASASGPLGAGYWKLLGSSTAVNLGDGIMAVAVVWLASALTRDPTLIALVGLASRLPWLLFSLPAGVLTDRFDRRVLVGAMDVARAVLVAGFAVVVYAHEGSLPSPAALAAGRAAEPANAPVLLALLCLLALLLGTCEVVRDNSAQTLMASVVAPGHLERANGRLWGAETAMNNFVGPPLGGVLVAVAVALPFALNAGLLVVGAAGILALRGSFRPRVRTAPGRLRWRAELGEGLRWLWRHRLLRTLALLLGGMNLLGSISFVVMVLFAQEILGLFEGWQYGAVITGVAVGAVVGAFVADRIARVLRSGPSLLAAIAVEAVTVTVIGLTSSAPVVWVAGVLSGLATMLWNVITVSLRQRIIPDGLLGRVNSVYRFFGWGTISLGTLLGGAGVAVAEPLLGREWALRLPFLLAGAGYVVLLLLALGRLTTARLDAAQEAAREDRADPAARS